VAYLLSSVKKYQDHVAELLTSSAEQRLARVLLRLAHLDKRGPPVVEIPNLSHEVLAEMVGTTRPTSQPVHESIQKAGIYRLRWEIGSAPIVAQSPEAPLEVRCQHRSHEREDGPLLVSARSSKRRARILVRNGLENAGVFQDQY